VASVSPGGPAAQAGLRPGEIIAAVAGRPTPDTETLAVVLAGLRPGQRVRVSVVKPDGGRAVLMVTLGQLPGS
jgi:S1-C subfamily serine protease